MNFVALIEAGFAGVSFALVWLAYDLVRKERKELMPRPRAMIMIFGFMGLAIVFAVLNLIDAAQTLAAATSP